MSKKIKVKVIEEDLWPHYLVDEKLGAEYYIDEDLWERYKKARDEAETLAGKIEEIIKESNAD